MASKYFEKFDHTEEHQNRKDHTDKLAYFAEISKKTKRSGNGRFAPRKPKEVFESVVILMAGGAFPVLGVVYQKKGRGGRSSRGSGSSARAA